VAIFPKLSLKRIVYLYLLNFEEAVENFTASSGSFPIFAVFNQIIFIQIQIGVTAP
jgi:hypothetical protein